MRNELYHEGRKGQKWGVRNGPPYPLDKEGLESFKKNSKAIGDAVKNDANRRAASKSKDANAKKNKKLYEEAHAYTDAELREIVNRMRLEEDYKTAMTNRSSQVSVGRKNVNDILQTVGTVLAITTSAVGLIQAFSGTAKRYSDKKADAEKRKSFMDEARGMTDDELQRANKRASAENSYVDWKMGKGGKKKDD